MRQHTDRRLRRCRRRWILPGQVVLLMMVVLLLLLLWMLLMMVTVWVLRPCVEKRCFNTLDRRALGVIAEAIRHAATVANAAGDGIEAQVQLRS